MFAAQAVFHLFISNSYQETLQKRGHFKAEKLVAKHHFILFFKPFVSNSSGEQIQQRQYSAACTPKLVSRHLGCFIIHFLQTLGNAFHPIQSLYEGSLMHCGT